jgi:tetratricopeptide (TPR) repeat protein
LFGTQIWYCRTGRGICIVQQSLNDHQKELQEMKPFCRPLTHACIASLALAGAVLLNPGCKPSADKIAAREARINQELDLIFEQVQDLRAADKYSEAVAVLDKALADAKYAQQKPRLFSEKIRLLLTQNNDAAAREAVLAAWKKDPACARAVFGTIHAHLLQMNRHAEIRAWCKSLLAPAAGLPADLRATALGWQLAAAFALADPDTARADIDTLLAELPPEASAPALNQSLGALIDAGQHAFADTLIRHASGKSPAAPLLRDVLATLSLRCAMEAKDWPRAAETFDACIAQLPDDQLLKQARAFFSALQKNGRLDLMEQASQKLTFTATDKAASAAYAARVWVECGVSAKKEALPERLDALLKSSLPPVQVGHLFDRYFYEMTDHPAIIRSLCTMGERLLAVCPDTNVVNAVKVKILDGAFITENYDLAVTMLEQGIPGKDKSWHAMSIPKVKAHRALAQNQPREAAAFFRGFMDAWIASDQQEEFDPTSGVAYSREWILGRNAKRIAGILDGIPDKAEADKARAEAKVYFKTALEKAANDPDALKLLKEETQGIVD